MTLTTLRLSRSGQTVSYRDHGAGEPVVLIHGVGLQSAAWGPQIAALKQTHRVIALDLPGHGGSDPLPVDSQLPAYVAWCHQVIVDLGVGPINLVGHSMGALIAGGFAVEHPDLTHRIALLNGVYRRDATSRKAVQARAAEIQSGKVDLETPLARWFGNTPTQADVRSHVAEWLGAVDPVGYATAYAAFAHGDATYADQLNTVNCPFLALTGADDPNSTPAMSNAMVEHACLGSAIAIAGHRHMINLTAADAVNAHLRTWLKQPVARKDLP